MQTTSCPHETRRCLAEASWPRLCRLLGGSESEARPALALRLRKGEAWQVGWPSPRGSARLVPRPGLLCTGLRLLPSEPNGLAADLDEVGLELAPPDSGRPIAEGWLAVAYDAPLWIEHLLRDLPLELEAAFRGDGGCRGLLAVAGLVLSEAGLPRRGHSRRLVCCRFAGEADGPPLALDEAD